MLSDTVGEQIAVWRKRRGWNRERLAEECSKLGMPELTHAAITNIESGRRNAQGVRRRAVTIDEVVLIAYALNIPPVRLLSSYPDGVWVEVLPGAMVASHMTLLSFGGEKLLPNDLVDQAVKSPEDMDALEDASKIVDIIRAFENSVRLRMLLGEQLADAVKMQEELVKSGADRPDEAARINAKVQSALRETEDIDESIVLINSDLEGDGYTAPALPKELQYLYKKSPSDYEWLHQPLVAFRASQEFYAKRIEEVLKRGRQ